MKKVIGKLVFLTLCALIAGSMSAFAQAPQPQWIGVNSLMPQALYWSAVCAYDGKIYVFGGNDNLGETNTTYIYDIAADQWTQGATMPTGRYLCTVAVVDGKMYVMGGRQIVASLNPVDSNECYDPATNSWTIKAKMPNAIRGHAACAANGKVYVMGGNTGAYTDTVSIYDPSANSWSSGTKVPAKSGYGGAVYSPSANSIFYVGGVKSSTASSSNFIGKVFAYSLGSGSWDAGTAMPDKTAYFGIATDDSGDKVYISGGSFWYDEEYPYPGTLIFNTATKTFEDTLLSPPSPANRTNSNAVFSNGSLYILEGDGIRTVDQYTVASDEWYEVNFPISDGTNYAFISDGAHGGINGKFYVTDGLDVFEYDPSSNMWSKKYGQGASAKSYLSSGVWEDKLVLYGGFDEAGTVNTQAYVYEPLADAFSPVGGTNSNINLLAPGVVLNGKFYIPGGRTDPGDDESLTNKLSILDLNTGSWSSGADLPVAIEQASGAAYNNKIYIFGGIDNSSDDYMNKNVYIYDPAANSWTTGPAQHVMKQAYGAVAMTHGSHILIDSGYNLFTNDYLGGLAGGLVGDIQAFDPAASTFTELPRPFGKTGHSSAIIGGKYYSTAGGDGGWIVTRLDIANFGGGGCTLTCTASANPTSGSAPLSVNFTGNATATGCTGTPAYAWTFGDGGTSSEQNPAHTYDADGSYNWTLTVTVDNQTCRKSGTVTVGSAPCTLTCDATASPATGTAPLNVTFTATATATNCTGTITYAWDFGDGGTSTEQNPSHTYEASGSYAWTMTATVDNETCSKTDTVVVGGITPPTISSVRKMTSPFRLKILGTGFASGAVVKINGVAVPDQKVKSSTQIVAKKGASLKAMCPQGVAVQVTVENPDGGVSAAYTYTR